jgi:hypothetical protein
MNCSVSDPPADSQNTTIATAVFKQIVSRVGSIPIATKVTLGSIDDVILVIPVKALTYLAAPLDDSTGSTFETLFYGAQINFTGADAVADALDSKINALGLDPTTSCADWVGKLGFDPCGYVQTASGGSCSLTSLTASLLGDDGSGNLRSTFNSASLNILFAQMIGPGTEFGRYSDKDGSDPALISPNGRRQLWYDASSETYEERLLAAPEDFDHHRRLGRLTTVRKYSALTWSWIWRILTPPIGWGMSTLFSLTVFVV